MLNIVLTEQFGRGIYSTRNIPKNTIIEMCELLVLSEKDSAAVEATDLKYYVYKFSETQDCLVLGNGELYNHSDDANVLCRLLWIGTRYVMQYYASRDILPDEQLFINYNFDVQVDTLSYTKNLIA